MSLDHPPHPMARDTAVIQATDGVIWFHEAFCGLALPMRSTRGAWQRETEAGSVRIEPSSSDDLVPSGRILRLSMMHICDSAFRANNQIVELGEDRTLLAAALGIDPKTRDLTDQWQRLQAARFVWSGGGGGEVSVFDARSRRRAGDLGWRSGVRLSAKFLSSLVEHAVALDRRVVRELSATPGALDAYTWIAMSLHRAAADQIVTTPWDDLLRRFRTASKDFSEFRSTFEAALRHVFKAESSIDLAVSDEGVSARRVQPAEVGIAAEGTIGMQPDDHVTDVDGTSQRERQPALTITPSVAEVALPAAQEPEPVASQRSSPERQAVAASAAVDRIAQDSVSLPKHLTGLAQVIWLRRGHGEENVLVGVTPGPRFEVERLTVLAVEPMVLQVSGGLNEKDFERVAPWLMTNRDVIDDFWEGRITSMAELNRRVRKAPAPGWR
ncbi:MAG: replication protein RepA [Roseococcus sp.]